MAPALNHEVCRCGERQKTTHCGLSATTYKGQRTSALGRLQHWPFSTRADPNRSTLNLAFSWAPPSFRPYSLNHTKPASVMFTPLKIG